MVQWERMRHRSDGSVANVANAAGQTFFVSEEQHTFGDVYRHAGFGNQFLGRATSGGKIDLNCATVIVRGWQANAEISGQPEARD